MQNSKKKILFVSHKANRSGAPLVLLEIIKEFKKQSTIPFQILIVNEGELVKEFAALGQTYVWNKNNKRIAISLLQSIIGFFSRTLFIARGVFILFKIRNSSLVFFNTIANGHFHKKLLFLKCRYIYYIHELEAAIYMLTNQQSLQLILNNTNLFIAVSEAVKNNLVNNYKIEKSIVQVLPTPMGCVSRTKATYDGFINSFKKVHLIPADAVIIGAVGPNEWRKGFDLFLPLITLYFNLFPESNAYFIWKGFSENNITSFFDLYDYKKFNFKERAILLPHGSDVLEQIACLDIHLLLSREDPYPLVLLESASFAIPTICFMDAGGSGEFIEDDCGYCVPYGDLKKMAINLNELVQSAGLRNTMGLKAQEKVKLRHDAKKTLPAFIKILESNF
ncbi:MAG TPA: glycosyltransferase family 4 protein [Chitinophagaceae bacterium]|nr:glycosyltransferase family 4 protein [Chitinophagaceae bacterium]